MLRKLLLLAVAALAITALTVPAAAPASVWSGKAEVEGKIFDYSKATKANPGQFQMTGSINEDASGGAGMGAGPCKWQISGLLWNEEVEEINEAVGVTSSYSQTLGCVVHGVPSCFVTKVQPQDGVDITTVGETIRIGTAGDPLEILRKTIGCGPYSWSNEPNVRGILSGIFDYEETGNVGFNKATGMEWFGPGLAPVYQPWQFNVLMSGEMTVWPKGIKLQ